MPPPGAQSPTEGARLIQQGEGSGGGASPGDSRGGPLVTDRHPAENPGEKFTAHGTPTSSNGHEGAQQVRGTLVVVVETAGGKYRRRCFLTLTSAQAAVAQAEAKGYSATVVLARLEPVEGWSA